MFKFVQIIAALSLILTFAGCSSQTLSRKDATQYSQMSLQDFLDKRFSDAHSARDGADVYYTTNFTQSDYRGLVVPTQNLIRFCNAQAGDMVLVKRYIGEPISSPNPHPDFDTLRNFALVANQPRQEMGTPSFLDGFMDYQSQGAYGFFECRSEDQEVMWSIAITPVSYFLNKPSSIKMVSKYLKPDTFTIGLFPNGLPRH